MRSCSPSGDATSPAEYGFCPSCDGITLHGVVCRECLAHEALDRGDFVVNLRPAGLAVLERGEDATAWEKLGYGIARVDKGISSTIKKVAIALIQLRAGWRLQDGDSLAFALRNVAGGRDSLADDLSPFGINRDQVAYALRELERMGTITHNGWLPWQSDPDGGWKKRAKKYSIRVEFRKIGDLAAQITASRTPTATVGVNRLDRRVSGVLTWALDNAFEGVRNDLGRWLADVLTDGWLPEDRVWAVMRDWHAKVNARTCGPAYTWTEAKATLNHQLRRKARARG